MIYLAFHKGPPKFGASRGVSRLIKAWTREPYSHTEMLFTGYRLLPNGTPAYTGDEKDSVSFSADGFANKVRFKEIEYSHPERWDWLYLPILSLDQKIVMLIASSLIGQKYDYKGILMTFVLPLWFIPQSRRQDDDRWWCSEVTGFLQRLKNYRVSPGTQYKQSVKNGAVKCRKPI